MGLESWRGGLPFTSKAEYVICNYISGSQRLTCNPTCRLMPGISSTRKELLMQGETHLPVANLLFLNGEGLICSMLTAKNQPPTAGALLYPFCGRRQTQTCSGRSRQLSASNTSLKYSTSRSAYAGGHGWFSQFSQQVLGTPHPTHGLRLFQHPLVPPG